MGVGLTETRWKTPPARTWTTHRKKQQRGGSPRNARVIGRVRTPPSTGRDHVTASAVPKYATAAARAARAASTDSIVSRLLCLTRRPVSRAFYFWDAPKCVLRASGHLSKFSDHDSSNICSTGHSCTVPRVTARR